MKLIYYQPLALALVGLLFLGLSIPFILGKVSPNSIYGFRTAKTLNAPQVWYQANTFAGWALAIAAGVIILAELIVFLLRAALSPIWFAIIADLVFIFPLVGAFLVSLLYLRSL